MEEGNRNCPRPLKSYYAHPCGFMRWGKKACEVFSLYGSFSRAFISWRRDHWLQPQEAYSPRILKYKEQCSGITGLSSRFHQLATLSPSFPLSTHSNPSPSVPRLTNSEDTKMIHTVPTLSPVPGQPSFSIMAVMLMVATECSRRLSLFWKYYLKVWVAESIHLGSWFRSYVNLSF